MRRTPKLRELSTLEAQLEAFEAYLLVEVEMAQVTRTRYKNIMTGYFRGEAGKGDSHDKNAHRHWNEFVDTRCVEGRQTAHHV